jgi:hypothetical protein
MQLTWTDVALSAQLAVLAFIFTDILIKKGMIFGWYGEWLDRMADKSPTWEYWTKPLGNCVRCFSGQVGLWTYLLSHLDETRYVPFWVRLACFVALTILCASVFSLVWSKVTKHRTEDPRYQACRPEK